MEVKRVAKDQAAAEAEMQWKVVATLKVEVMAMEIHWITEEKVAAAVVVRQRVVLEAEAKYKAEWWVEEMELGQDSRLLVKWKGQVEGEQVACDHCMTWGSECQVCWFFLCLDFLLRAFT